MAVRGITSGAGSYLASSNPYQAVQTAYTQIQQNLTAGNLDGARDGLPARHERQAGHD